MAAVISEKFGVQPKLVAGVRGVFDVVANGALIYSKHQTGRFPEDAEILKALGK